MQFKRAKGNFRETDRVVRFKLIKSGKNWLRVFGEAVVATTAQAEEVASLAPTVSETKQETLVEADSVILSKTSSLDSASASLSTSTSLSESASHSLSMSESTSISISGQESTPIGTKRF